MSHNNIMETFLLLFMVQNCLGTICESDHMIAGWMALGNVLSMGLGEVSPI
jgi:hypothetical protein